MPTASSELKQRLAAILAADVAGYSRLMSLDERATVPQWLRSRMQGFRTRPSHTSAHASERCD